MILSGLEKLGSEAVVALVFMGLVFQLPVVGFLLWFIQRQSSANSDLSKEISGRLFDVLSQNSQAIDNFGDHLRAVLSTLDRLVVLLNKRRS